MISQVAWATRNDLYRGLPSPCLLASTQRTPIGCSTVTQTRSSIDAVELTATLRTNSVSSLRASFTNPGCSDPHVTSSQINYQWPTAWTYFAHRCVSSICSGECIRPMHPFAPNSSTPCMWPCRNFLVHLALLRALRQIEWHMVTITRALHAKLFRNGWGIGEETCKFRNEPQMPQQCSAPCQNGTHVPALERIPQRFPMLIAPASRHGAADNGCPCKRDHPASC